LLNKAGVVSADDLQKVGAAIKVQLDLT
jgi:hypothetical protein